MPTRIHISTIVLIAFLVSGVYLFLTGYEELSAGLLAPFTLTVTALTLLFAMFDKLLWRWNLLQGWFVKRPHLWGTWKAELRSDWIDPETGEGVPPIEGYMAVHQTRWAISIRLMTAESSGELMTADLLERDDGAFRLSGVYRNEPKLSVRERSPIHYGAFLLDVEGDANAPARLYGHYWTDRNTKGELTLVARTKTHYQGFDAARHGFKSE